MKQKAGVRVCVLVAYAVQNSTVTTGTLGETGEDIEEQKYEGNREEISILIVEGGSGN
jgi:hypothetical protein